MHEKSQTAPQDEGTKHLECRALAGKALHTGDMSAMTHQTHLHVEDHPPRVLMGHCKELMWTSEHLKTTAERKKCWGNPAACRAHAACGAWKGQDDCTSAGDFQGVTVLLTDRDRAVLVGAHSYLTSFEGKSKAV